MYLEVCDKYVVPYPISIRFVFPLLYVMIAVCSEGFRETIEISNANTCPVVEVFIVQDVDIVIGSDVVRKVNP
jgi:hypothetical protein